MLEIILGPGYCPSGNQNYLLNLLMDSVLMFVSFVFFYQVKTT